MEAIAEKLLDLVPGAFVVIVTVLIFLRHSRNQHSDWLTAMKENAAKQRECQDNSTTAIGRNTELMGKVKELIELRIRQNGG